MDTPVRILTAMHTLLAMGTHTDMPIRMGGIPPCRLNLPLQVALEGVWNHLGLGSGLGWESDGMTIRMCDYHRLTLPFCLLKPTF